MASRDRSRSPMCCRSCAECSCDHRGIITRQNEIIARQEREITWQKEFIGDRVRETARQERQIARILQELAAKDADVNNLRAGLRVALERQSVLELRELNTLLDMARKVKDRDISA